MGMSASQVRFLSLQSRKNDVSRQLMSLSNKKMSLSRDMNKVSQHYTDALNQKSLMWSNDSGATYKNLSYDLMMKPNDLNFEKPYIVSTRDGRVVVDNITNLIGRNADGEYVEIANSLTTGQPMSYAYFANKITNAAQLDGSKGSLYTTTEGLQAGTANKGVYIIPQNALEYGFENSLRYELFQELGLVNEGTTNEYNSLLNEMYGTEEAYKYGNYNDLLKMYLNFHKNGINEAGFTGHDDFAHIMSLNGISSLNASGTEFGAYKTNYGYIDQTTGTWAVDGDKKVGSLMGNLALAELAIEEYDNWCNELKTFNLNSDTTFNFTATSGRSKSWTVQPFLNMNNVNNTDGGVANDFYKIEHTADDGSVSTFFDPSWLTTINGNFNNYNWTSIYNEGTASVELSAGRSKAGIALGIVNGLVSSLDQGSDQYKELNGVSWTFNKPDGNSDMVEDGQGNLIPVDEAAKTYAINKTVKYFGELEDYDNNYGGCGSCHTKQHFYNKAADADNNQAGTEAGSETNTLGRSNSGRCFWHSITHFLSGVLQTIAGGIWTALTSVISIGGLCHGFIHLDTGLVTDGWDNFTDTWSGDGAYYTMNAANVEKTYLTYYEMFMQAHKDGYNLLTGEGPAGTDTVWTTTETDKSYYYNKMASVQGSLTMQTHTVNPVTQTITYSDGTISHYQVSDGKTAYDTTKYTFNQSGCSGSMIVEKATDSEGNDSANTTIQFNTNQEAQDAAGNTIYYNKIKEDANGNVRYYLNNTDVTAQITKEVHHTSNKYSNANCDLQISSRASKFTKTITAYITPDATFKVDLEKDRQDALDAIAECQDRMKNFFSAKETKLMDYYDAIFLRISENGWVQDNKVNKPQTGRTYLANKLMNNDYFVTECKENADDTGYNYTNKIASNVMKIFEVNDTDSQNQALSKYEADKTLISNKERRIDAMMQKLETEQEAINTELESVQKIVNDNIDKTFKMFA